MPNFMSNFIAKISSADFLPNFKVAEFEPGDLGPIYLDLKSNEAKLYQIEM